MSKEMINEKIRALEEAQYQADLIGNDERSYDLGCQIYDLLQEIPEDR
jgi:hypothetical protein